MLGYATVWPTCLLVSECLQLQEPRCKMYLSYIYMPHAHCALMKRQGRPAQPRDAH